MTDSGVENDTPRRGSESDDENEVESPDIHFEPLMRLPEIDVKSLEEDEETIWKARAKLYRYETKLDKEFVTSPQWKERGLGEVKLLQHKSRGCVRLLMRREQTLKICANHLIMPMMNLSPHHSPNTWIWTTLADFADEEPKMETLALRFKDVETSVQFQTEFENAKRKMADYESKCAASAISLKSDTDSEKTITGDKTSESDVPETDVSEKECETLAKDVEKLSVY